MESRSFHQSIIWCGHRRCCRCVCHSILRQNKQQGISLQKYTLFRKKGIIWMMKYSPVICFKICYIFGIGKLNSLTNEMKKGKKSLCINLLFLKCEESGYFFRGCFAEKRDFCYAAEFATQFIKLICCEKKNHLMKSRPWRIMCYCLYSACSQHITLHSHLPYCRSYKREKFSSHFSLEEWDFLFLIPYCAGYGTPQLHCQGKNILLPSSLALFFLLLTSTKPPYGVPIKKVLVHSSFSTYTT